jgi:hypothetical protein
MKENSHVYNEQKLAAHGAVALYNRFMLRESSLERTRKKPDNKAMTKDSSQDTSPYTALRHFGVTVENNNIFGIFVFEPKINLATGEGTGKGVPELEPCLATCLTTKVYDTS